MTTSTSKLLWPREHGAYGQVLLPLLTGLGLGWSSRGSGSIRVAVLLATAVVGAFLAHEAVLVASGRRGPRIQKRLGPDAFRTLLWLWPGTLLCGGVGAVLAPAQVRVAIALVLLAGVLLFMVIVAGMEKTTGGEVLAASIAASTAVPVTLAAGASRSTALVAWWTWSLAFAVATAGVRVLLARHKRRSDAMAWLVLGGGTATLSVVAFTGPRESLAALPQLVVAWSVVLFSPSARRLKQIGWGLVAASVITACSLLIARGGSRAQSSAFSSSQACASATVLQSRMRAPRLRATVSANTIMEGSCSVAVSTYAIARGGGQRSIASQTS